ALRRYGFRRRNNRPGTSPGSLEPLAGSPAAALVPARLTLMQYASEGPVHEPADASLEAAAAALASSDLQGIVWLHLQGMPSPQQLRSLGEAFGLHALALEDVLHRGQRAKSETYDTHQFVILNLVLRDPETGACRVDQVSLDRK